MQVVHLLPASLYIFLPPRFTTFSNKYWTNSDCSILSCLGNSFPFGHGVSEFFSYETLFTHLFPYMVLHKSAEFRGIFLLKIEKIRGITRNLSFFSDGFQRIPRNSADFFNFQEKDSVEFRGICQKKLKDSALLRGFVESFFFKLFLTNSA